MRCRRAARRGTIFLAAGPVFTTYEFKQSMPDRLTDGAWRDLLASPGAPTLPEWTAGYRVR